MVDKAKLRQAAESEQAGAAADAAAPPVHVPGPSVWPATLGLGVALLLFGILSSWAFSVVGLAVFVWAIASWVTQLRQESLEHEIAHETEVGSPHRDAHA